MRNGWKSIAKIFVLAVVLDVVYQWIRLRWFYPGEALLVAILLAIVPYLCVHGPANLAVADPPACAGAALSVTGRRSTRRRRET